MQRALFLLGIPFLLTIPSPAEDKWQLNPSPSPPSLHGFMEAADLSGIALNGKSKAPSEADLEGVAWVPGENAFYLTGSHGVGKKKGDFQPLRCRIWKIPFNQATGTAHASAITSSSLLPWLETSPVFRDHLRQPLQSNGFNIEGLAWHRNRLWFGTRGPCTDGHTHLIATIPADLFRSSGEGINPAVHRIPPGDGRGIRELASVQGGATAYLLRRPDAPSPP